MNNAKPLVSVICATHNASAFVLDTVESIRQQTYSNLQIIIVDDNSEDNTIEILKAINDERIQIIPLEDNVNVCRASYAGYKIAKGRYIALIGHDDIWKKNKIEEQVKAMEKDYSIGVSFTATDTINEKGKKIPQADCFLSKNIDRNKLLHLLIMDGNCLCASSAVIRKSILNPLELYDLSLLLLQDYDLWIRILMYHEAYIINDKLTMYRRFTTSNQNLSNGTEDSMRRFQLEKEYVLEKNLFSMPPKIFVESFGILNKKEIKENDVEYEKCMMAFKLKLPGAMYHLFSYYTYSKNEISNHYLSDFYKINFDELCQNCIETCTIYWKQDGKYSEENSLKQEYIYHNKEEIKIEFNFPTEINTSQIRFDPVENSYISCRIKDIYINDIVFTLDIYTNKLSQQKGNRILFCSDDPQYYLDIKGYSIKKVVVICDLIKVKSQEINNALYEKIAKLESDYYSVKSELARMENHKVIKLYRFMKGRGKK